MTLDLLKQLAHALAVHFGENCEVVIYDLKAKDIDNAAIHIENPAVTHRTIGDSPSHVVLETLKKYPKTARDHLGYLTKTKDGKILKSSTLYIKNEDGEIQYLFSINFDISVMLMMGDAIREFLKTEEDEPDEPERIPQSVTELLDELILKSVRNVGKPVALMTKEDKVAAIKFLNDSGAFLITKSGDKIARYFGISKYTLYSYLDMTKQN
ncbi:MAG: helix-turn-helix transcriptional regulator [Eubacteriales bacterium]|nr:helix-turn-helix transcriptional regulator [Eubacteriales bacterium]